MYGKGVKQDYTKAAKLFTLAAEQGWVDGQLNLGYLHFSKFHSLLSSAIRFGLHFLFLCYVFRVSRISYFNLGRQQSIASNTFLCF